MCGITNRWAEGANRVGASETAGGHMCRGLETTGNEDRVYDKSSSSSRSVLKKNVQHLLDRSQEPTSQELETKMTLELLSLSCSS